MNAPGSFAAPLTELQVILDALPGAYLLLSPELQVAVVSAGHQAAPFAAWPALQPGQHLPTALAAAPAGPCLPGQLEASLQQVLRTGQPHEVVCPHPYQMPVPSPGEAPLGWQLHSQPVRDAQGVLRHILCRASAPGLPSRSAPPVAAAQEAPAPPAPFPPQQAQPPAPAGVALCLLRGPACVVEFFNPLAAHVWGRPAGLVLGQSFLNILSPAMATCYAVACAAAWQSGQAVVWAELPMVLAASAAEAEISYFSLIFQPFRAGSGPGMDLLLVAQEITPLLQARQQIRRLQAELAATTNGLADCVAELIQTAAEEG